MYSAIIRFVISYKTLLVSPPRHHISLPDMRLARPCVKANSQRSMIFLVSQTWPAENYSMLPVS